MLDLVKELGVTCVRYPGGNFVSNYNWEDGIGPRENRPVRRDLAWHCTETNEMGIDDFYRWSQKAGTEIMLAVNMGTRGLKAALDELEYVNGAPGTAWADQRVANGIEEPMDIKMWCIGNEMDGPWQVGHMSPEEYASAVDKVAHAMKLAESGLELVACGSSGAYMPTFGTWEKTVLTKAYENLDFVSCHAYYFDRGHKTRTAASMQDFLASSEDMTKFIATVSTRPIRREKPTTAPKTSPCPSTNGAYGIRTSGTSRKTSGRRRPRRVCTTSHGLSLRICWKTSTPRPTRWSKVP